VGLVKRAALGTSSTIDGYSNALCRLTSISESGVWALMTCNTYLHARYFLMRALMASSDGAITATVELRPFTQVCGYPRLRRWLRPWMPKGFGFYRRALFPGFRRTERVPVARVVNGHASKAPSCAD